eukprot:618987-Alexandrium_andersonii.AAC.1
MRCCPSAVVHVAEPDAWHQTPQGLPQDAIRAGGRGRSLASPGRLPCPWRGPSLTEQEGRTRTWRLRRVGARETHK